MKGSDYRAAHAATPSCMRPNAAAPHAGSAAAMGESLEDIARAMGATIVPTTRCAILKAHNAQLWHRLSVYWQRRTKPRLDQIVAMAQRLEWDNFKKQKVVNACLDCALTRQQRTERERDSGASHRRR